MGPGLTAALFALSPAVGLGACVALHVAVSRAVPTMRRMHVIVGSVLAGLGLVVGMGVTFAGLRAGETAAAGPWSTAAVWVLTYVCLTYCYVIGFFNLGESARRIRLLIELDAAGERGMTREEILAAYNARMIVDARLTRLLSGGQIALDGGRYVVRNPLGLYVAKALVLLKLVVLGARSEFGSGHR